MNGYNNRLTKEEEILCRTVVCPKCNAQPGDKCVATTHTKTNPITRNYTHSHMDRRNLMTAKMKMKKNDGS